MIATATQKLAERWSDEIRSIEAPDGPGWLTELREGAVGAFRESGLPHRKVEAWKYTPLRLLETTSPALPAGFIDPVQVPFGNPLLPDASTIIDIVDGTLPAVLPQPPRGVTVLPFADALGRFEREVRALAEKVDVTGPGRAFAALNTAYIHHGLVVHVEAGVDAGSLLMRWACSQSEQTQLTPFRLIVLLGDGASLELVEQHTGSESGTGAQNLMMQFQLGEKSELKHIRVQNEGDEAVLLTSTSVEQAANSRYGYFGFDLGGGLVRHELNTELAGSGATASLSGACVLDGTRHGDTRVSVDHAAPGCSSEQFFRGVLGGRSRGVFNSRALIREGADGSSVRQSNANLLLSRLAEVDTKPELEIYADEVEASHGATVGQLDETAVFYLRSRGLSEAEARLILTSAFCHAVTSRVANRELADRIAAMVDEAMPEAR
jgi:Fe-S cluster assembly protein SufD